MFKIKLLKVELKKNRRTLIGSFPRLKTWYENQYQPVHLDQPVSPRKSVKKKPEPESTKERPPLIIVLEDFESFSPQLLQNFIRNLR
jgi:hypothetical protein